MALFDFISVPDTIQLYVSTESVHSLTEIAKSHQFNEDFSIPTDELGTLVSDFGYIGGISCIGAIIVFSALWFSFKGVSVRFRDLVLQWGFPIVWILGFIVYDIGTCTGEEFSLITNAPMAVLHSLGMFLLDSDVSAIHEPYHNSWVYMFFFSVAHFLAAVISSLFLIKHFGYNILAKLKIYAISLFGRKKNDTFVFWGLNEATYRLINSIKEEYKKTEQVQKVKEVNDDKETKDDKKDKKSFRIIVVRTNKGGDDTPEKRTGINRVFRFLSLRNSELDRLQKLKCLSTDTYADFSTTNPSDKSKSSADIIGRLLNLRSLRRILKKKTRSKIHMLFLSDNENENLHDAALILGDKTINDFSRKVRIPTKEVSQDDSSENGTSRNNKSDGNKVVFYCHARYNSVHRVVEDLNATDKITVRVVDSSHINVEMLKKNKDVLPVNFVDVNADATVSSAFNALVVGFSEVGQDSVRFIYEFGAFVKKDSTNEKVERSGFSMHVVDRQMSDLAGTFIANAPAIKPAMPFLDKTNDEKDASVAKEEEKKALITLHEMDCRSAEFYLKMEDWIKELNYIVLATDDDELNISLGVRLFKMAVRYRDNLDKLCILVRTHNDDDGHIRNIVLHYNRLWEAQKAAGKHPIEGKPLNQATFKREGSAPLPIYIFGLDKDVYTFDNIIDDSLEQEAVKYKETYESSTNKGHKYNDNKGQSAWDLQFKELMQLGEIEIEKKSQKQKLIIDLSPYYPTYGGLMKLRRTEGQDFANCLHQTTKELLAEKALQKLGLPKDFTWTDLSRKMDTTTYILKSGGDVNTSIVRILDVLAQTEHLRWNASHEILGYTHADKDSDKYNDLGYKDEVRLIHNCIRDWQGLDETKKSYDYNVVDITLGIITPDNPIGKKKN